MTDGSTLETVSTTAAGATAVAVKTYTYDGRNQLRAIADVVTGETVLTYDELVANRDTSDKWKYRSWCRGPGTGQTLRWYRITHGVGGEIDHVGANQLAPTSATAGCILL